MKLKTPQDLGITPEQFKNLCILTTFVRKRVPPPAFDISIFNANENGQSLEFHQRSYACGTTACFLGYGPLAGVSVEDCSSWGEYSDKRFGSDDIYNLLFNSFHANNALAACRRAAWFLSKGFPTSDDLTCWEAPSSFRAPWKLIEQHALS